MKARTSLDSESLQRLLNLSSKMVEYAEQGEWESVSEYDHKRRNLLKTSSRDSLRSLSNEEYEKIKDEIFNLDEKIKQLASIERKRVIKEGLREKAQVAAHKSYQRALATDNGL
jgi:hypothetical protein